MPSPLLMSKNIPTVLARSVREFKSCNINIRLQTLLRKTVFCGPIAKALAGESQTEVARISFWVLHIATDYTMDWL